MRSKWYTRTVLRARARTYTHTRSHPSARARARSDSPDTCGQARKGTARRRALQLQYPWTTGHLTEKRLCKIFNSRTSCTMSTIGRREQAFLSKLRWLKSEQNSRLFNVPSRSISFAAKIRRYTFLPETQPVALTSHKLHSMRPSMHTGSHTSTCTSQSSATRSLCCG